MMQRFGEHQPCSPSLCHPGPSDQPPGGCEVQRCSAPWQEAWQAGASTVLRGRGQVKVGILGEADAVSK